jgi:citrate synthase
LKIGRQKPSKSAISTSNADVIVVRGMDLCRELIGQITFTDQIWLLVAGRLPSDAQRHTLDAALVAIAEHGLVPSVVAGRMTLAAAPEALQGAVAAGLLGCGSVILGAAESAARLFADIAQRASGGSIDEATRQAVSELHTARRAIPGYGHPLHKRVDPRAQQLLAVAKKHRVEGNHVAIARAVEKLIPQIVGKPLVMNVSAAIGAILLDAGYPLLAVKGVPLLARTASLVAHLLEEQERPIGFALADSGASSVGYDGVLPVNFVPSEGA